MVVLGRKLDIMTTMLVNVQHRVKLYGAEPLFPL